MSAPDLKQIPAPIWALLCGGLGGPLVVLLATRTSPVMALAGICGLLIVAAVFTYPRLGFLLTVAVIPIERLGRFTSDSSMYTVSLMRIVGIVALGGFIFQALLKKWKIRVGMALLLYVGYSVFAFLTIFYTSDKLGTVRAFGAVIGNLIFFFLITNMVRDWKLARIGVLIWLGMSVLAGVYTIVEWHYGSRDQVEESSLGTEETRFNTVLKDSSEYESLSNVARAIGTTSHSAVYGINLILTLPFFAYLFRTQRSWQIRMLVMFCWAIICYNILLTNTRATLIIAALVMLLCVARRLLPISPPQIMAAVALGVVMMFFVPADVYKRVLDVSNYTYKKSGTFRIRMEYWAAALQIAQENWMGIGIGNHSVVPKYLNRVGPEKTSVHNEYLNTLMEVGLLGWLMFFGFVGFLLWCSFKTGSILRRFGERRDRVWQDRYWFVVGCQIAMISVIIYAVQVDVFHFPLKGWWLVAALTWSMYVLVNEEKNKLRAAATSDEAPAR